MLGSSPHNIPAIAIRTQTEVFITRPIMAEFFR